MNYEEIVAGFRALQASDFDCKNISARGWKQLAELTEVLMNVDGTEKAIPEMFSVVERLPDADLGSPEPLVHTMERWRGNEDELAKSVRRCPSMLSLWMVNSILNTANYLRVAQSKDTATPCRLLANGITSVPV